LLVDIAAHVRTGPAAEIILNERYKGPAVDLWSLGVILYTLLMGSQPFHDENPVVQMEKIVKVMYPVPTDISPGLSVVVFRWDGFF
jgi:serine/threonine protein kinase